MTPGHPTTCRVCVIWARMKEHESSIPQFVAAFSEGEVEAQPESYQERREAVQRWYGDESDVEFFFATWNDLARPELPDPDDADDVVYACAACGWQATCADGCHAFSQHVPSA